MKTQSIEELTKAARSHAHESTMEVAPGVTCIRLSIVNAYMISASLAGNPGEWVLVDAGLYGSAGRILRAAAEEFGDGSRPSSIILTHGHFDHVGAVRELADLWNVPVYAHRLEMPYITGQSAYPPPDPFVGGGAMALLSFAYPRQPTNISDRILPLPEDGTVPGLPEWRWIHTPGHTPGHVALFRESDRVLIAGDAFVTTRQESATWAMAQPQEINGPPMYFTPDWLQAQQSVEILAQLDPNIAATGHGRPMAGEAMKGQLNALARNFRELAVPARGRYVDEAAVADERGVMYVPPPIAPPAWTTIAGFGAGLALAALIIPSARSRQARRYRNAPFAKPF